MGVEVSTLGKTVEMLLNNSKVNAGGFAEVFKFVALKFEIFAGRDFFVNAGRADLVANGDLAGMACGIGPTFVPNPDILAIVEKFTAMALWDGTKNHATEARFGINQLGTAGTTTKADTGGFLGATGGLLSGLFRGPISSPRGFRGLIGSPRGGVFGGLLGSSLGGFWGGLYGDFASGYLSRCR